MLFFIAKAINEWLLCKKLGVKQPESKANTMKGEDDKSIIVLPCALRFACPVSWPQPVELTKHCQEGLESKLDRPAIGLLPHP